MFTGIHVSPVNESMTDRWTDEREVILMCNPVNEGDIKFDGKCLQVSPHHKAFPTNR